VATRNYEPDSGAYFISLLWNYYRTPGLYAPERLLNETVVHDAVATTIRTWRIEQRHEERSPYRWAGRWLAAGFHRSSLCHRAFDGCMAMRAPAGIALGASQG
jgi:meiotically up-regulated gene 157 (Mug157) protein